MLITLKDKKYKQLSVGAGLLSMLSFLLWGILGSRFFFVNMLLVGASLGWIAAIWVLRLMILREEAKEAKEKSEELLKSMQKTIKETSRTHN